MPRYDFKCNGCGAVRPDVWVSNYRDAQQAYDISRFIATCDCGSGEWEKLPSAPNFAVTGFNAANGYGRKG